MSNQQVFKTREEWRNFWLECYKSRYVDSEGNQIPVDVGPGSYPWVRASAMADALSMQSATAAAIGEAHLLDNLVGDALDKKFGSKIPRSQYARALGGVEVEAGSAGTIVLEGDTLVHGDSGNRYRCTGDTASFANGAKLTVESIGHGPSQDLPVGSVLTWETSRAGRYATCKVVDSGNGLGLSGGRDVESDEAYRERIRYARANPSGGMNEGELIMLLEESSPNEVLKRPGHGVPVEKGFVYPAIHGPGTCALAFTLKGNGTPNGRVPISQHLSTVIEYVSRYASARDMLFFAAVVPVKTRVDVAVSLRDQSARWTNSPTPWPPYRPRGAGMLVVQAASSPTAFTVGVDSGTYDDVPKPAANTVIGLFNESTGKFVRKHISSISGAGPWQIVCTDDPVYQSDASYTPQLGQSISPWIDAGSTGEDINSIAQVVLSHVNAHGPGEMTPYLPLDGKRMQRVPLATTKEWPQTINARLDFELVNQLGALENAQFLAATPASTPVGNSIAVYLLRVADVGVFKS